MIKFIFAGWSSANTIVDVVALKFRFCYVISGWKVGVARSHFDTHGDAIDVFIVVIG